MVYESHPLDASPGDLHGHVVVAPTGFNHGATEPREVGAHAIGTHRVARRPASPADPALAKAAGNASVFVCDACVSVRLRERCRRKSGGVRRGDGSVVSVTPWLHFDPRASCRIVRAGDRRACCDAVTTENQPGDHEIRPATAAAAGLTRV